MREDRNGKVEVIAGCSRLIVNYMVKNSDEELQLKVLRSPGSKAVL